MVTDVSTTWAEVIIRVKWKVVVSRMYLVRFVYTDWSVLPSQVFLEIYPFINMITNGFFFISNRSNASQLVTLYLDSKQITVLCQMGNFGCGYGGWTPVMKTDGNQVSLIWWNILGEVFLRLMKRQEEIFRSVETTIESLGNSPILFSLPLRAQILLA